MPRTNKKPHSKPSAPPAPSAPNNATGEVLTLAEAAAYLRVKEDDLLRIVGPRGLPGRLIGNEWRFSKFALQEWLRAPIRPSTKEAVMALAGSWKDDPYLDEMLRNIYKERGRPMTEEGE